MGAAVALTLLSMLGATACTADGHSPADPASSGSPGARAVREVATKATIGTVTGRLTHAKRGAVRKQIAAAVDRWLDAAYIAGDYPRAGFADAFPGFTRGAESDARKDIGLMSNAAIGKKIDGVEARHRRLRIDVLAVRKHAVGVTARFLLDFDTTGKLKESERVQGRLYMTRRHGGGWQVFGYDVSRGIRR
jgi:hypothetical protein